VLLFTYYKDTARYLYRQLCDPAAAPWRADAGEPHIRRMDSGVDARERAKLVTQFAPRANNKPEIEGSENEVDILISTDVLSEGQNLQDCGVLINYDLHWNPTRMVQRAGRIEDNRFVITNLVQCQPDTPRVVPFDGEVNIFALQEKVIASIVQASIEQVAVEEAPRLLDPIQQTIATVLSGYINSPAISRKEIIAAIQQLNAPQPGVYIKTLRKAYDAYLVDAQLAEMLSTVQSIARDNATPSSVTHTESKSIVRREGLKLVCFDYVW